MTEDGAGPFFAGVDVEFLDGELVVERRALPRWTHPAEDCEFGGVAYRVYGFNGPTVQEDGRHLFRVFVRPSTSPTDASGASPEAAPS
jgi:hypothetical protein